jgi:GGDEF domain-containing protein
VGLLALDVVLPEFYPELRADAPRSPEALETLEGSLVSVPHSRLGAWLLRRWGLSLRLQSVVACSHDSTVADSTEGKLAACVELSASLAALALQPANSERSRQLAADAKRLLALAPADVARVHRQAAMTLNEAESAFEGTAEGDTPNRTVVSLSSVATLHQAPRAAQLRADSSGYSTLPDPVTTALTLERELAASRQHGWPLSVALLQTAGCGTPLAQRSLDQAVRALRRTLRPSDLMGRHDQDRLLVTMPGAGRDEAAAAARRITQALAEVGLEGLGVATTSPEAPLDSWESLLALAERALSAAWRVGSGICSAG